MVAQPLHVIDLGLCDYDRAWDLQRSLHERIAADPARPAALILVEHPPVITLGRRADPKHVLLDPDRLQREGILRRQVDRGGDVTYHGPGQLVAYPIVRLAGARRDVHAYFRDLEQVVIDLLAEYAIAASRVPGLTGVWVGDDKICAMGVTIKRWVTYHGLALNVNTDLAHFRFITPCGIADRGVTSMRKLLGRDVPLPEVAARLVSCFARRFDLAPLPPGTEPLP